MESDASSMSNEEGRDEKEDKISAVKKNNGKGQKKSTKNGKSSKSTATATATKSSAPSKHETPPQPPPAAAAASKSSKKSFTEMVHFAIESLKDRTGSSQIAIQKYILAEFQLTNDQAFRTRVVQAIKTGIKNNRFCKYKASFKINTDWKKRQKARKARDVARKQKERKNRQVDIQKKRKTEEADRLKSKSLEENDSKKQSEPTNKNNEDRLDKQRKRDEAEQKARDRADRLRRRRFPMEDTRLHSEDREYNIKPPTTVKRRPFVPYLFQLVQRHGKSIAAPHSRCEYLGYDSRGLISDLLQVYHFFHGDVNFANGNPIIADFTLTQLLYATDEIINGNAKKNKLVPPLIVHLFVTSLNLLLASPVIGDTREAKQLQLDLTNLHKGLSPVSWSEICALYMDCMERYYMCPSSLEKGVLQGGFTDTEFLLQRTNEPNIPETMPDLPDGYGAYLGDARSSLAKAHTKIVKSDPWNLTAEELLALLRALIDDIVASRPELAADLSQRDDEMYALTRAKKAADANFRKIKLAYEGPKNKPAPKKDENPKGKGDNGEKSKDTEWKQSASKRQFEQAQREQLKANKQYEESLRSNICRSEPVGVDRNFNRVYSIANASESLFLEMIRPPTTTGDDSIPPEFLMNRTSWHVLENVSIVDEFTASLDIRGHRENALKNVIEAAKKHVHNDLKEEADKAARKKKRQDLEIKLEEAREALRREDENGGRRSGRLQLQSPAQTFLSKVTKEIDDIERKIKVDEEPIVRNYNYLTGLENLLKYEAGGKRKSRKMRELESLGSAPKSNSEFKCSPCGSIWPNGTLESGLIGAIVNELLSVEELCERLVPQHNDGADRFDWIAKLKDLAASWINSCPAVLGPDQESAKGDDISASTDTEPETKKRKIDVGIPASYSSTATILTSMKQCLLYLEARIFEVSGLAMATRDADEADDNMSIVEDAKMDESEQEQRMKLAWRKKIHSLRSIPAKRPGKIRETIVQAITAARKAQQGKFVNALRKALLVYHPDAPAECKFAAIAVLDENGGYDASEDTEEEDDVIEGESNEEEEEDVASHLSGEAMMLTGSLGGDDNANRVDWIGAVKTSRTLSRLSALAAAFCNGAKALLEKLLGERESLDKAIIAWGKMADRAKKQNKKSNSSSYKGKEQPTEVWTAVHYLDEFCMVKLENYPFWPARKCRAKDTELDKTLNSLGRCLVSLIGEDGRLRVVKSDEIEQFTGVMFEENLEEHPKEIRSQLVDCVAMARRIVRGHTTEEGSEFVEEKKTPS